MSKERRRKERTRKALGRRIIAERRASLEKKPRRIRSLTTPGEKTILLLFLLFISFVVFLIAALFLKDNLLQKKTPLKTETSASEIRKSLQKTLPGSFWLAQRSGEEVRLESARQNGSPVVSIAYLNREAVRASKSNPSSFTYLLRNETDVDREAIRKIFIKNSKDVWQKGDISFFIAKRTPWREFYLLSEQGNIAAVLLNASGLNSEGAARDLFDRLQVLGEK